MASIAHLAAGAACGAVVARATGTRTVPTVAAFSALALAPDLDLLAMPLRPKGTPIEHRVMTHSLLFSAVVGGLIGARFGTSGRKLLTAVLSALALASHGILDAMTHIGHAPRILWPFTWERIALPWQPIPGAESFREYFAWGAVDIFAREAILCAPFLLVAVAVLAWPEGEGRFRWRPRRLARAPRRAQSAG